MVSALKKRFYTLAFLAACSMQSNADTLELMCPNADFWGPSMITDICWSCLFPLKIMGVIQMGGGNVPPDSSNQALCFCTDDLGVAEIGFGIGMWQPSRLVEIVRKPYCSPTLGGVTLRDSFRLWGMRDGGDSSDNQFYNYHWFSFPLLEILELLITPECNAGGYTDFDLMYMSEVDPTWNEDEVALFTNPEAAVAANPLLQMACMADCAGSTFNAPLESLWWCSGCWGSLYPFTGNVNAGGSMPRVTSLLATRAAAALHRRGLAWKTVGDDAMCGGQIYPMLPKTQYRMQMLFPISEASNEPPTPPAAVDGNPGAETTGTSDTGNSQIDNFVYDQRCCHNIGSPTMLWGEWRNIPGAGEDAVHVMFRWVDCCVR